MKNHPFLQLKSGLPWFALGFLLTTVFAFTRFNNAPTCVISLDKMNVFYIGVDNPISVLVSGAPQENVLLKVHSGSAFLKKTDDIHYNVRVTTPGETRLTVSCDSAEQTFLYRVKRIPDPVSMLGGKHKSKRLRNGEFRAQTGLLIVLENFDYDLTCAIAGFSIVRVPRKGDPVELQNTGPLFNAAVQKLVEQAAPGDTYFFDDIRVKCPGDEAARTINSLTFFID
jgi:hypothetical protein